MHWPLHSCFINQMSLKLSICSWSTTFENFSLANYWGNLKFTLKYETSVLGCSWHSENSKDNAIFPIHFYFILFSLSVLMLTSSPAGSPLQLECSAQYLCVQWSQTVQWSCYILSSYSYWQQVWDQILLGSWFQSANRSSSCLPLFYHLILENK